MIAASSKQTRSLQCASFLTHSQLSSCKHPLDREASVFHSSRELLGFRWRRRCFAPFGRLLLTDSDLPIDVALEQHARFFTIAVTLVGYHGRYCPTHALGSVQHRQRLRAAAATKGPVAGRPEQEGRCRFAPMRAASIEHSHRMEWSGSGGGGASGGARLKHS